MAIDRRRMDRRVELHDERKVPRNTDHQVQRDNVHRLERRRMGHRLARLRFALDPDIRW